MGIATPTADESGADRLAKMGGPFSFDDVRRDSTSDLPKKCRAAYERMFHLIRDCSRHRGHLWLSRCHKDDVFNPGARSIAETEFQMDTTVMGLFRDRGVAEQVKATLIKSGLPEANISFHPNSQRAATGKSHE